MIISLNWLKKFTDITMPIEDLATLIGARLVEIEESVDLGAKYKDVLIVKVVESSKLEDSDHLSLTKIDDGHVVEGIERDENGYIQVVCGAPNMRAELLVAWLPPNSVVPETYGKPDQFILGSRKLRGYMSNGMIASGKELDLSDDHEGILELQLDVKPGTSFAAALELDDVLLDIANKSLTHRPDCFGVIGFAREVSAIQGKAFNSPSLLSGTLSGFGNLSDDKVSLNVSIDNPELSDRYLAVVMSDVDASRKTPLQIQTYLSRVGVRPINAVVDVTNYLMMLTGQPLHAFDYDKLVALNNGKADIHVRSGRDKEKLILLDGREIDLSTEDIIISSGETAIGLAGAMGGISTAIDSSTKNIIIESATFNLYNLRSTQMRHGIFSEAITRFTKGQPAELSAPVLIEAIKLMNEWAGVKCVSKIAESYPGKKQPATLIVETATINDILGSKFIDSEIIKTLHNVGFEVENNETGIIKTVAPYWRADIHIIEDIVEEIGRLNGFDSIEPVLPKRDFSAIKPSSFDDFRKDIRKVLVKFGGNEVLTYSFIHGNILQKSGQDVNNSYRIVNSISPDLQYYRQTLTPSLLDIVNQNIRQGYDNFALFELNKTHQKNNGMTDENVPVEIDMMSMIISNKNKSISAPYYQAKKAFDYLCVSFGIEVVYEKIDKDFGDALFAPFEIKRSAKIINKNTGELIGVVGEYKKSAIKNFKLPENSAGFEIKTRSLFDLFSAKANSYRPISKYPAADRDICFEVEESVDYAQIFNPINDVLKEINLESLITPIDIYQASGDNQKRITVRIRLTSRDHTLTSEEIADCINNIISKVVNNTSATVI